MDPHADLFRLPAGVETRWATAENPTGEKGYGLFERHDDGSSRAYFYLDRPENGLPPLPAVQARIAGLSA